jgi:hypothetical protein
MKVATTSRIVKVFIAAIFICYRQSKSQSLYESHGDYRSLEERVERLEKAQYSDACRGMKIEVSTKITTQSEN